jgi:hypothetical protein
MSLAKQISGLECSAMPEVVLYGSQALRPQAPSDDPAEVNAPSSSFKVQLERGISPAARLYALRQLAHRAAIPHELLNLWKVEVKDDATVLTLGRDARIRFRHAPATFWHDLVNGNYHVVPAAWPHPPVGPLSALVPDFIVPFVDRPYAGPLFVRAGEDAWECPIDLLASMVLTLSRFEELQSDERDMHGRFLAAQSVALKHNFLHRPIVDEYGLALQQVIELFLPGWRPPERKLRVKLSHDVDEVGIPLDLTNSLGHTVKRHKPFATLRDLLSPALGLRPSLLEAVFRITELSKHHGLASALYWKNSPKSEWDSGYDLSTKHVLEVVSRLKNEGVELGVHPSYYTFNDLHRLGDEVEHICEVFDESRVGGRQHFLRWHPRTWHDWEKCGLAYDSTVGFSDHIGFRAGTCVPYRPWSLELNREIDLLEIPLLAMDVTLAYYMHLAPEESVALLLQCAERCKIVGGVFTLLWHNRSLLDPNYGRAYQTVLEALKFTPAFDWKQALRSAQC